MAKQEGGPDPAKWGQVSAAAGAAIPMVFHFQPHTIVAVAPENRAEFERYFEENVGFPPPKMKHSQDAARAAYPNGGVSGSNGGWDDCIP